MGLAWSRWVEVLLVTALCLALLADAAEWHKFRKCDELAFCERHREAGRRAADGEYARRRGGDGSGSFQLGNITRWHVLRGAPPEVDRDGRWLRFVVAGGSERASQNGTAGSVRLEVAVAAATETIFAVRALRAYSVAEHAPRRWLWRREAPPPAEEDRFRPTDDVVRLAEPPLPLRRRGTDGDPACAVVDGDAESTWITVNDRAAQLPSYPMLRIQHQPFRIELYAQGMRVARAQRGQLTPHAVVNARDLWYMHPLDANDTASASVAADVLFPRAQCALGLPQHTLNLRLPNTHNTTPIRLYNLDVFEYELEKELGLYGSIPMVMAFGGSNDTVGALWMPASETYVDVRPVDPSGRDRGVHVHFYSEHGVPELFLFAGPHPQAVARQLAQLTGPPAMPPLFALGYHQSRWNYLDESDVRQVNAQLDAHDIPCDVLWLDIEHTDAKKYFTWDVRKFPHPDRLQRELATRSGRQLVTIVDPHIKSEPGYSVHEAARRHGWYVKQADGVTDYDGHCWPGRSHYIDFADAAVRQAWASRFTPEHYPFMTEHLHIWVDMNEPSVFSGPEGTMPKDARHVRGRWAHGQLHNIYGHYMQRATFQGLKQGRHGRQRPFVLSRSFFTGTQRYGAVWTGDNRADWAHLRVTVPMLLSMGVGGLSFVGADVGGFFGDPSPELLVRWYQVAAFQPFFRAHAHLDTKRREPWLFGEPYTAAIRAAIEERYALLPYWYTLLATEGGVPPMRPLAYEFPDDAEVTAAQSSWMVGAALLVAPVMQEAPSLHLVDLPGDASVLWYALGERASRLHAGVVAVHRGGDQVEYAAPGLQQTFTYQRGGTVVARRERRRKSAAAAVNDPYTLHVALDARGGARGRLYIDDGRSYAYRQGAYWLVELQTEAPEDQTAAAVWLCGRRTDPGLVTDATAFDGAPATLERIVVYAPCGQRAVLKRPNVTSLAQPHWQVRVALPCRI
ncbi:hypothetical protein CDCA_CDCA07G2227 [Cyanidium caldarium]|uniref:Glycoside hydrolase family 31 N-terminal domain-containing protein n=1 Tax=Cyanidium caldarium TaxID=2771 RepID=A0AAV9IV38_CYACA|nr:hypothetical protein CDCA_CDCA07G2227 [Cyanidium caldarium]